MTAPAESVLRAAGEAGLATFQLKAGGAPKLVWWGTELPPDLVAKVPLVQVTCFGGEGGQFHTFTNPRMDFDCFALTRTDARQLAYDVREWFTTQVPGQIFEGTAVLSVLTGNEPVWTPYDNTNLRRFVWTTQARLHSQGAA